MKSILKTSYLIIYFLVCVGITISLYILDYDPMSRVGSYILSYSILLIFFGVALSVVHFIVFILLWLYKKINRGS